MNPCKKSEINITVELDENHLPLSIKWTAEAGKGAESSAFLLSFWDRNEKVAFNIDLWTKDMLVDEMKVFFFQTLNTMADSFFRATNDKNTTEEMRNFAGRFGKGLKIIKK